MSTSRQPKGKTATPQDVLANNFAQIPMFVLRRKDVCGHAKLLYGLIVGLCREKGHCFASNVYFADLFAVQPTLVSKWLRQLRAAQFVETVTVGLYNGRGRHIYLLAQRLSVGEDTQTNIIKTHKSPDPGVSNSQDDTQTVTILSPELAQPSSTNDEYGLTRSAAHNIYLDNREEDKANIEFCDASADTNFSDEDATIVPDTHSAVQTLICELPAKWTPTGLSSDELVKECIKYGKETVLCELRRINKLHENDTYKGHYYLQASTIRELERKSI